MKSDKDVKDGLYLFYVKDKKIYPVIQSEDSWNLLQGLGNAIFDGPVQVLDESMGYVEHYKKKRRTK